MYSITPIVARDAQTRARHLFYDRFNQLHRQANIKHIWLTLLHHEHHLQDLHKTKKNTDVKSSQEAGIQMIPIHRIRGSEGRTEDFDREFRPLKKHSRERWLSVASARYLGQSLPPIQLVRVGCDYFVRDGHHRISVAKAMGQSEIEAEVMLWNAESEEVCTAAALN